MSRPTVIENLYGRPGKRAPPKDEPIPEGELGDPPEQLSPAQAKIWQYYLSNSPKGLLTPIDRGVMAVYVIAESLFLQAVELQAKRPMVTAGTVTKSGTVLTVSPYLRIIREFATEMRGAAYELGFTPSARTKIKAAKSDGKPDSTSSNTRDDKGKGPKRSLGDFLDTEAA